MYQQELSAKPAAPESAIQKILSPDGNLRAEIRNRPERTFQVEVRRQGRDDSPDRGITETWKLIYRPAITSTLGEAVELANQRMGA